MVMEMAPFQMRTKYGSDISTTPAMTRTITLETKYGNAINVRPQTSGTTAR